MDPTGAPSADLEQSLAAVLAEAAGVDEVAPDSNFFDELGADSMVMAQFCARARKRDDLPTFSIRDVYQHPTLAALAASVTDTSTADPSDAKGPSEQQQTPASIETEPDVVAAAALERAKPVGRIEYGICALLQILTAIAGLLVFSLIFAASYDWVSVAPDIRSTYVRSAITGGAIFLGLSLLPIVAKWLLIGRWKPRQVRVWSLGYYRFWLAKRLIQSSPLLVFIGSPIYNFYLRALGAKIGRGVVIFSRSIPVCTDLLTIGDRAVIRKDSLFPGYRASGGWIQTGSVTIGSGALVGEQTVIDVNTSLGKDAQIGHASAIHAGQSIPDGERRVGAPAYQRTETDLTGQLPTGGGALRRFVYPLGQLLLLFGFTLPVALTFGFVVIESALAPDGFLATGRTAFSGWIFYRDALIVSAVIFFGALLFRLILASTVPRLLNKALKPGRTYPLYSIRYGMHRLIGRWTNVLALTTLFGDSSYIVHYLRLIGYNVSTEEQTGSNFGTGVKHDNPYAVTVGQGTMVADGLSVINADYSNTSFQISPVKIGSRSFLGNNIGYPANGKTGENCLHGTKVMIPVEGPMRQDVGLLGSPGFEIPRTVFRDQQLDGELEGDARKKGLRGKNRHNLATIAIYLFSRWLLSFAFIALALGAVELYEDFGFWAVLAASIGATFVQPLYIILMERASIGFRSLSPLHCSILAPEAWRVERYWKMSWRARTLNGTPFKSFLWRLTGVRLGKRVFDDGCLMVERSMIVIGDHCTLNAGSVIQPHSQEDGSYKSDNITIGSGVTVGTASLVHYGVTMGDGSSLGPNSFLMKGSEVEPGSFWTENPAREISRVADQNEQATAAQQAQLEADEHQEHNQQEQESQEQQQQQPSAHKSEGKPMKSQTTTANEYWQEVLLAGGATRIPRWTQPTGVCIYTADLGAELQGALEELGEQIEASVPTLVLTANGKVAAALSGEQEVTTGYIPDAGTTPLPCRLPIAAGT